MLVASVTSLTPGVTADATVGAGAADEAIVAVRDLRLAAGDVVAVALHPSTVPIELSARRLDLEACPASWGGDVAAADDSSWPRSDGFTECIPFTNDAVTLPATASGGGAMHLVFAVRALDGNARPGVLEIRYAPVDSFFVVGPPDLAPGARSASLVVRPTTTDIATGFYRFTERGPGALSDLVLAVRQRGRKVPESQSVDAEATHAWPVYEPVEPGRPVIIRATNDGPDTVRYAIGLDVSS